MASQQPGQNRASRLGSLGSLHGNDRWSCATARGRLYSPCLGNHVRDVHIWYPRIFLADHVDEVFHFLAAEDAGAVERGTQLVDERVGNAARQAEREDVVNQAAELVGR